MINYMYYYIKQMEASKKKCCNNKPDLLQETRIKLLNEISMKLKTINNDVSTIKKDIAEIKTKMNDDLIIEVDKKGKSNSWWY